MSDSINYILIMGICGVGKTTVGLKIAKELGIQFVEGDDWHPKNNKDKMKAGIPLTDTDRFPWLENINKQIRQLDSCVVACSALKQSYREILFSNIPICSTLVVFLHCEVELLNERMASRKEHFMPTSLIPSQMSTLEPPTNCLAIDVAHDGVGEIVSKVKSQINERIKTTTTTTTTTN